MKIPRLTESWCGCSLQTGTKIISIFSLVCLLHLGLHVNLYWFLSFLYTFNQLGKLVLVILLSITCASFNSAYDGQYDDGRLSNERLTQLKRYKIMFNIVFGRKIRRNSRNYDNMAHRVYLRFDGFSSFDYGCLYTTPKSSKAVACCFYVFSRHWSHCFHFVSCRWRLARCYRYSNTDRWWAA